MAYTPNHWCNEDTMVDYLEKIFLPYVKSKREELGLSATYPALAIFDEFNGQTTDAVLSLLKKNHIYYVIVSPNCTDRLQPLDISVNKPAKEFLRACFQSWYAEKIASQVGEDSNQYQPVELKLSVMKPLRWLLQLYDHFKSKPNVIINGFKDSGVFDSIKC